MVKMRREEQEEESLSSSLPLSRDHPRGEEEEGGENKKKKKSDGDEEESDEKEMKKMLSSTSFEKVEAIEEENSSIDYRRKERKEREASSHSDRRRDREGQCELENEDKDQENLRQPFLSQGGGGKEEDLPIESKEREREDEGGALLDALLVSVQMDSSRNISGEVSSSFSHDPTLLSRPPLLPQVNLADGDSSSLVQHEKEGIASHSFPEDIPAPLEEEEEEEERKVSVESASTSKKEEEEKIDGSEEMKEEEEKKEMSSSSFSPPSCTPLSPIKGEETEETSRRTENGASSPSFTSSPKSQSILRPFIPRLCLDRLQKNLSSSSSCESEAPDRDRPSRERTSCSSLLPDKRKRSTNPSKSTHKKISSCSSASFLSFSGSKEKKCPRERSSQSRCGKEEEEKTKIKRDADKEDKKARQNEKKKKRKEKSPPPRSSETRESRNPEKEEEQEERRRGSGLTTTKATTPPQKKKKTKASIPLSSFPCQLYHDKKFKRPVHFPCLSPLGQKKPPIFDQFWRRRAEEDRHERKRAENEDKVRLLYSQQHHNKGQNSSTGYLTPHSSSLFSSSSSTPSLHSYSRASHVLLSTSSSTPYLHSSFHGGSCTRYSPPPSSSSCSLPRYGTPADRHRARTSTTTTTTSIVKGCQGASLLRHGYYTERRRRKEEEERKLFSETVSQQASPTRYLFPPSHRDVGRESLHTSSPFEGGDRRKEEDEEEREGEEQAVRECEGLQTEGSPYEEGRNREIEERMDRRKISSLSGEIRDEKKSIKRLHETSPSSSPISFQERTGGEDEDKEDMKRKNVAFTRDSQQVEYRLPRSSSFSPCPPHRQVGRPSSASASFSPQNATICLSPDSFIHSSSSPPPLSYQLHSSSPSPYVPFGSNGELIAPSSYLTTTAETPKHPCMNTRHHSFSSSSLDLYSPSYSCLPPDQPSFSSSGRPPPHSWSSPSIATTAIASDVSGESSHPRAQAAAYGETPVTTSFYPFASSSSHCFSYHGSSSFPTSHLVVSSSSSSSPSLHSAMNPRCSPPPSPCSPPPSSYSKLAYPAHRSSSQHPHSSFASSFSHSLQRLHSARRSPQLERIREEETEEEEDETRKEKIVLSPYQATRPPDHHKITHGGTDSQQNNSLSLSSSSFSADLSSPTFFGNLVKQREKEEREREQGEEEIKKERREDLEERQQKEEDMRRGILSNRQIYSSQNSHLSSLLHSDKTTRDRPIDNPHTSLSLLSRKYLHTPLIGSLCTDLHTSTTPVPSSSSFQSSFLTSGDRHPVSFLSVPLHAKSSPSTQSDHTSRLLHPSSFSLSASALVGSQSPPSPPSFLSRSYSERTTARHLSRISSDPTYSPVEKESRKTIDRRKILCRQSETQKDHEGERVKEGEGENEQQQEEASSSHKVVYVHQGSHMEERKKNENFFPSLIDTQKSDSHKYLRRKSVGDMPISSSLSSQKAPRTSLSDNQVYAHRNSGVHTPDEIRGGKQLHERCAPKGMSSSKTETLTEVHKDHNRLRNIKNKKELPIKPTQASSQVSSSLPLNGRRFRTSSSFVPPKSHVSTSRKLLPEIKQLKCSKSSVDISLSKVAVGKKREAGGEEEEDSLDGCNEIRSEGESASRDDLGKQEEGDFFKDLKAVVRVLHKMAKSLTRSSSLKREEEKEKKKEGEKQRNRRKCDRGNITKKEEGATEEEEDKQGVDMERMTNKDVLCLPTSHPKEMQKREKETEIESVSEKVEGEEERRRVTGEPRNHDGGNPLEENRLTKRGEEKENPRKDQQKSKIEEVSSTTDEVYVHPTEHDQPSETKHSGFTSSSSNTYEREESYKSNVTKMKKKKKEFIDRRRDDFHTKEILHAPDLSIERKEEGDDEEEEDNLLSGATLTSSKSKSEAAQDSSSHDNQLGEKNLFSRPNSKEAEEERTSTEGTTTTREGKEEEERGGGGEKEEERKNGRSHPEMKEGLREHLSFDSLSSSSERKESSNSSSSSSFDMTVQQATSSFSSSSSIYKKKELLSLEEIHNILRRKKKKQKNEPSSPHKEKEEVEVKEKERKISSPFRKISSSSTSLSSSSLSSSSTSSPSPLSSPPAVSLLSTRNLPSSSSSSSSSSVSLSEELKAEKKEPPKRGPREDSPSRIEIELQSIKEMLIQMQNELYSSKAEKEKRPFKDQEEGDSSQEKSNGDVETPPPSSAVDRDSVANLRRRRRKERKESITFLDESRETLRSNATHFGQQREEDTQREERSRRRSTSPKSSSVCTPPPSLPNKRRSIRESLLQRPAGEKRESLRPENRRREQGEGKAIGEVQRSKNVSRSKTGSSSRSSSSSSSPSEREEDLEKKEKKKDKEEQQKGREREQQERSRGRPSSSPALLSSALVQEQARWRHREELAMRRKSLQLERAKEARRRTEIAALLMSINPTSPERKEEEKEEEEMEERDGERKKRRNVSFSKHASDSDSEEAEEEEDEKEREENKKKKKQIKSQEKEEKEKKNDAGSSRRREDSSFSSSSSSSLSSPERDHHERERKKANRDILPKENSSRLITPSRSRRRREDISKRSDRKTVATQPSSSTDSSKLSTSSSSSFSNTEEEKKEQDQGREDRLLLTRRRRRERRERETADEESVRFPVKKGVSPVLLSSSQETGVGKKSESWVRETTRQENKKKRDAVLSDERRRDQMPKEKTPRSKEFKEDRNRRERRRGHTHEANLLQQDEELSVFPVSSSSSSSTSISPLTSLKECPKTLFFSPDGEEDLRRKEKKLEKEPLREGIMKKEQPAGGDRRSHIERGERKTSPRQEKEARVSHSALQIRKKKSVGWAVEEEEENEKGGQDKGKEEKKKNSTAGDENRSSSSSSSSSSSVSSSSDEESSLRDRRAPSFSLFQEAMRKEEKALQKKRRDEDVFQRESLSKRQTSIERKKHENTKGEAIDTSPSFSSSSTTYSSSDKIALLSSSSSSSSSSSEASSSSSSSSTSVSYAVDVEEEQGNEEEEEDEETDSRKVEEEEKKERKIKKRPSLSSSTSSISSIDKEEKNLFSQSPSTLSSQPASSLPNEPSERTTSSSSLSLSSPLAQPVLPSSSSASTRPSSISSVSPFHTSPSSPLKRRRSPGSNPNPVTPTSSLLPRPSSMSLSSSSSARSPKAKPSHLSRRKTHVSSPISQGGRRMQGNEAKEVNAPKSSMTRIP